MRGPDVLDQPRAVWPDRPPDGCYGFGRVWHVVNAIEGHDEVVTVVGGQVRRTRGNELHIGKSAIGQPRPCTLDRVPGRVEAVEPGGRETGCHRCQGDPGTTSDVGHQPADIEAV